MSWESCGVMTEQIFGRFSKRGGLTWDVVINSIDNRYYSVFVSLPNMNAPVT